MKEDILNYYVAWLSRAEPVVGAGPPTGHVAGVGDCVMPVLLAFAWHAGVVRCERRPGHHDI